MDDREIFGFIVVLAGIVIAGYIMLTALGWF